MSAEARRRVCAKAKVDDSPDWPIEVAEASRVGELLRLLRDETDPDDRFALMELLLYSLDETDDRRLWRDVEDLLLASPREYAGHILYWSCLEEAGSGWTMPRSSNRRFGITPLARRVLVAVKDELGFDELDVPPDALDEAVPLESYEVLDDLGGEDVGAIEVRLRFADGTAGWCFFVTPESLRRELQPVAGTRALYGMPHMIVVDELGPDTIARVLAHLDDQGRLEACSLPEGEVIP